MRLTKVSIDADLDMSLGSVRQGFETLTYIYGTDEFHEGTNAFLERRQPQFGSDTAAGGTRHVADSDPENDPLH
jgi:1,4-dihydroxy-2-naphthoyl-CoA synthase